MLTKRNDLQQFRWSASFVLLLFVGVVALFGTQGCDKNPAGLDTSVTTNYDADAALADLEAADNYTAFAKLGSRTLEPAAEVSLSDETTVRQWIGPDGGTIKMLLGVELVTFTVPSGAVDRDVEFVITGTKFNVSGNMSYTYDCSPSPMSFNVPIILTQPVNSATKAAVGLWYDTTGNGDWELQNVVPVGISGSAEFEIDHFSKYGIS
ncbi:MAG: hypothetical protein ABIE70_03335 [bacterium]